IHSLCLFMAGAAVFNLALLLSTVFTDLWRPFLIALSVALVLGFCERLSSGLSRYGVFHAMRAEAYFRTGEVPWQGLLTSALASAAMLYAASAIFQRRDF